MYEDEEEAEEHPKSSFATYYAEGSSLFKQGEYDKALDSFSLALELKPADPYCLVARSRTYLRKGDNEAALRDAEAALVEDKDFNKGLYQKAEALYAMGDFEYALVFYHRGNKLRPELQEFRLGIQKAQEAIDNSIGAESKIKLENKGDLSFFAKQDEMKKPKGYSKPTTQAARTQQQQVNRGKQNKSPAASDKTCKQLLGELYQDKKFLEDLCNNEQFINYHGRKDDTIQQLVEEGLDYLKIRTEFWQQQKPLYARKKETPKPRKAAQKQQPADVTKFILRSLEEIDMALADGDAEGSLKQAQDTLRTVQSLSEESVPNKDDVLGNLHSCIGNAYLELDNSKKALEHHMKDLKIAEKLENRDGKSRALDNLGRVHAKSGEYSKAIDRWMEKMPLVKTPLESTWLFHEIGRCHLELKNYQDAKEYGQKSLAAAQEASDQVWQLNATVLIAQAEVKLAELQSALESFQQAHDLAKILEDEAAESAISKAIRDVNDRIAQGVKPNEEEGGDQATRETGENQSEETSQGATGEEGQQAQESSEPEQQNEGSAQQTAQETTQEEPTQETAQEEPAEGVEQQEPAQVENPEAPGDKPTTDQVEVS